MHNTMCVNRNVLHNKDQPEELYANTKLKQDSLGTKRTIVPTQATHGTQSSSTSITCS